MNWNKSISDTEWELIEQYLDGELNGQELEQFENRLQNDPEWKELTESCRMIRIGIAEASLAEKLNDFHTARKKDKLSVAQNSGRGSVQQLWRWVAAAMIVLAAGLGGWWWMSRSSAIEKTYQAYYQPDPGLLTVMGPAESYQFDQAMVQYKAGEYRKAAEAWDALLAQSPANDTIHYFLGAAQQALGQWDQAEQNYKEVVSNSNSRFYQDASWYLGLIYLRTGKPSLAREWIQKSSHPQRDVLLNELKE